MLGVRMERSLEALAFPFLGDQLVLWVQRLEDLRFQSVTGSVLQQQYPPVLLHQWPLLLIDMEFLTGTFTHRRVPPSMREHFLLTVNHSVPQNHSSTPQVQWQHHTVQVSTKLHTVVQGHSQVQAAMQLTLVHQVHHLQAAMQII